MPPRPAVALVPGYAPTRNVACASPQVTLPYKGRSCKTYRALKSREAGCPGSRGVRDPGGSSSITRPAKPRTHPGLEKRETLRQAQGRLWGTHSYLILLPKIKDGSGQETRATRQEAT